MHIHYFQRYHKGEDVATANTMLLLSRLYSYSADKFFQFLKDQYFGDVDFEPEISFVLQEGSEKSIPDAIISQQSFRLIVETKLTDWFYEKQLINHLSKFENEEYKVLITISSEPMDIKKKEAVDKKIEAYNIEHQMHIIHINTTFELLAKGVKEVLSERDYDMQDILEDYFDYCCYDGLIPISEAWKRMRMQLAGTTFDFNVAENVYYDGIERRFNKYDYLALYKQKSIRAIGKVQAIITAVLVDDELEYEAERGELTEERKQIIARAIEDGKRYGYILNAHRYFFVDKFCETDFPKVSPRAPMGPRVFDLTEVLGVETLPGVETIATMLKDRTWS